MESLFAKGLSSRLNRIAFAPGKSDFVITSGWIQGKRATKSPPKRELTSFILRLEWKNCGELS